MSSRQTVLYLLLALALIRGLIYASIVPPWQAPDEPAQFERVRAALSQDDWPRDSAHAPDWYGDLVQSLFIFDFWNFANMPRQEYDPAAPFNRYVAHYGEIYAGKYGSRPMFAVMAWPLLPVREGGLALQLYLVRLNMVFMNVGVILFAYLIARALFPGNLWLNLGVPLFILFNPQHTHLLAAVNNGNLAELLVTAALYFLVQTVLRGPAPPRLAVVLGLTLLAMWSKATAYFLVAPLALLGLIYLVRGRRHWRRLAPVGLLLAALVYFLEPARFKALRHEAYLYLIDGDPFYLDPNLLPDIFRSFWAAPGWTNLYLDLAWYRFLFALSLLSLAGLGFFLATRRRLIRTGLGQPRTQALLLLLAAAISAVTVQVGWHILTGNPHYRQARSVYPVMVPLVIFLLAGWEQLIPPAWRRPGLLVLALALFLFDTLVLLAYIVPFFYSVA